MAIERDLAIFDVKIASLQVSKSVAKLSAASKVHLGDIIRKATVDILHAFQVGAPVDTGRFRAGWSPYIIENGGATLVEGDDGQAVAEGRAKGSFQDKTRSLSPSLTVSNGVIYGPDLELGRSPQASAGFHEAILLREAARLGSAAGG